MSKLLVAHLKRIGKSVAELRRDLAFVRKRKEVAENDVRYYGTGVAKMEISLAVTEALMAGLWLQLMNSGISHRNFLKVVKAWEAACLE